MIMKKAFKLLGLCLALGCSVLGAKAQTFGELKYRAEAGVTASKISNFGDGKALWGMRVAGFAVLPFEKVPLSLNSGIVLTNKGERHTLGKNVKTKTALMYLQVPVEADFTINLNENNRIHLAAGPYLGLGLFGESKDFMTKGRKLDLFEQDGTETPFNRFEFGIGGSVAYQYTNFYLKAGAELGLTNAINKTNGLLNGGVIFSDKSRRNAVAYLTFGYEF